jgi:hypothetical protein
MELSEVRRRVRQAIERARHEAEGRRAEADRAAASYETFRQTVAEPLFRQLATVLKAEGHPFELQTPAASVRLVSGRSGTGFIEVGLDTTLRPPAVVGRAGYGRGRDVFSVERPLVEGAAVADLTEEDVLTFVTEALGSLVQR